MAVQLTKFEENKFEQARRGNLNAFSEHFFRLPRSGTRYTTEDHVDDFALLYEYWKSIGSPGDEFDAAVEGHVTHYLLEWDAYYGTYPIFLLPHGYLFLPWLLRTLGSGAEIVIAEGGTGSSKTSGSGISSIMACALWPGVDVLNVAPTLHQASDMLTEITKWVENSEFEKFVVLTNNKELFKLKPYPTMTIDVYGIKSTFSCMTVGKHGDYVLGKDKDRLTVDEAGLLDDIGSALPKLVTRVRGIRQSGIPRGLVPKIMFITNPHDGNFSFDLLKEKAKEKMKEPKSKWFFIRPSTEENVYITKRQMDFQRELMDEAEQLRWHDGSDEGFRTQGTIPRVIIENCHALYLDDALIRLRDEGGVYEERDGMGVIHFEIEPVDDPSRRYLAWGDPGTANATPRANNVPTVGVFDITGFPEQPATLVALRLVDGMGKYEPWIRNMTRLMYKYKVVMGAYDATGMGKAFGEWPEMQLLPLHPVDLAGGHKATSRTMFILFAGKGMFAWPKIKTIWDQAHAYREFGPGAKRIPDDVIAGLFVATFYLRYEFWDKLASIFNWDKDETDDVRTEPKLRRSRYGRRSSRYRKAIQDSDFE